MKDLHDKLGPICGEDSLQALNLALRLVHSLLWNELEQGRKLCIPRTKTDFPIEAYFGTGEQL
jgi:hypothetical protein